MGESFRHEFTYSLEGGELEDQDLECVAMLDERGSGEDYECDAELVEVKLFGVELLVEDLPATLKSAIEEKGAESYMEGSFWDVKPGKYVWKGKNPLAAEAHVEVLGAARVPGRSDWVLVVRSRAGILKPDRVRLLEWGDVHGDAEGATFCDDLLLEPAP